MIGGVRRKPPDGPGRAAAPTRPAALPSGTARTTAPACTASPGTGPTPMPGRRRAGPPARRGAVPVGPRGQRRWAGGGGAPAGQLRLRQQHHLSGQPGVHGDLAGCHRRGNTTNRPPRWRRATPRPSEFRATGCRWASSAGSKTTSPIPTTSCNWRSIRPAPEGKLFRSVERNERARPRGRSTRSPSALPGRWVTIPAP